MSKRQNTRKTLLIISFLLFPATFYYLSPYLIIDGALSGIITGSFVTFALLFISSVILGRAYCGWVCPASEIQDQIAKITRRRITEGNFVKWMIWIPWISVILLIAVKNGGFQKIDPLYQTTLGLSIGNVYALITYLLVLMLMVVPAFLIGKRSFCHSICWMAPFMILGRKLRNLINLPALQLASVSEKCISCHTCSTNCPMSLPVEQMVRDKKMENAECILCGTCVDGCKSKVIGFDFGKMGKR